jgi:hypothetical protein
MVDLKLDEDVERVTVISRDRLGKRHAKTVFRRDDEDEDEDEDDDGIKRVVVIQHDAQGRTLARTLHDNGPLVKEQSRLLRPLEKRVRRLMRRRAKIAQLYLAKHQTSNVRKRNGWARNLAGNLIYAYRKGR